MGINVNINININVLFQVNDFWTSIFFSLNITFDLLCDTYRTYKYKIEKLSEDDF